MRVSFALTQNTKVAISLPKKTVPILGYAKKTADPLKNQSEKQTAWYNHVEIFQKIGKFQKFPPTSVWQKRSTVRQAGVCYLTRHLTTQL